MSPWIRISRKKPDGARSVPSDTRSQILREIAVLVQSAGDAREHYRASGDRKALDAAALMWEQAISHPHFETTPTNFQVGALNSAGGAFMLRYEVIGRRDDLEKALVLWEQALQRAPSDSMDRPSLYNNRGNGLRARYAETVMLSDLDEAIRVLYQAVQHTPPDSPHLAGHLSSLGASLGDRYDRVGGKADLEESLRVVGLAVRSTPNDSPELPRRLSNLAVCLTTYYASTGQLHDLEAAIQTYRYAIQCMPANSPDLPAVLSNLANDLRKHYARTDLLVSLDEAVDNFRRAVHLTAPGSPHYVAYLSNLGAALSDRYRRNGQASDIQEAIQVFDQAIKQAPPGSPYRPKYINNLGMAISARYARSDNPIDLDDSIRLLRQAVEHTSVDSPELPDFLNNLSTAQVMRFKYLGRPDDFHEAREGYKRACTLAQGTRLETALGSALNWAACSFERCDWKETIQAYSFGRQTIDLLFATQTDRQAKESWLKDAQGMPASAAYALAKLDRLQEAVETMEAGRARLLAEALEQNRRDLEQLEPLGHGDLLARYRVTAGRIAALRTQAAQPAAGPAVEPVLVRNFAALSNDIQAAQKELDAAIAAIRQVPGYEDFFQTPDFSAIQRAARPGAPLVYLVTTAAGSVALVVRAASQKSNFSEKLDFSPPSPVDVIWLDDLTEVGLRAVVYGPADDPALGGYLGAYQGWLNARNSAARQRWFDALDRTTRWLWDAVMAPLLDHLARSPLPASRATLIPTGLLALLPLHAARTEDASAPTGRRYALDVVTINYAASARALSDARQLAASVAADGILAVDNPDGSLVFARQEVAAVRSYFPPERATVLQNTAATRRAVLDQLPDYPVFHFSTHGRAGWSEPLESGLLLAGGSHLTLRDLLGQRLAGARLAVLSACETGVPGTKLVDEVVSLPSGFAQAGVAGVVASLWAVNDMSTAMLMERFYRLWREDGLHPGEALRQAQIWLRDATNQEMVAYFEQDVLPALAERMPAAVAADFAWDRLFKDANDRNFAHPFFWAAFTITGV